MSQRHDLTGRLIVVQRGEGRDARFLSVNRRWLASPADARVAQFPSERRAQTEAAKYGGVVAVVFA